MATNPKLAAERWEVAWRGFSPGTWRSRVNVREFIQRNYTPYEGDGAFLQGATERTKGMWKTLQPLLAKERENGSSTCRRCLPGSSRTHPATSTRSARSSSGCRLNKQIAADLDIAEQTVKQHRGRVMEKIEVRSVAELVRVSSPPRGMP